MRPVGDFRAALRRAAMDVGPSGGTWRELGARAQVSHQVAQRTAENMRRAGELVAVGKARVEGTNRPAVRLAAASLVASAGTSAPFLLASAWHGRPPAAPAAQASWLDFV